MSEMVIPGTYIEVRAEGLIAAGPITISNVGIVGTARRGRINTAYTPSNIGEVRDLFGDADPFENPDETGSPLSLVRALELAFANGAQRVYAVRVAAAGGLAATYTLNDDVGPNIIVTSVASGSGYNDAEITVSAGSAATLRNLTITLGRLFESFRDVPAAVAEFAQVVNGTHPTYAFGSLSSTRGASSLFTVDASAATGNVAEGDAAVSVPGTNGAVGADYTLGLAALENEDVHIVVLGGQDESLSDELIAHVESASTDLMKHERIGVIGGESEDAPAQDEGRLIYVRPGIQVTDSATRQDVFLPASYSAAAVAGRIASLDAHFSPTNKTVNVGGLATIFNGTELAELVRGRTLALERRLGSTRIVKGITTSTNTAWAQVTTRRIVDYARYGVRSACDPYIGKLNNERVRQAMKSTVSGLLNDMVDREMLISYDLEVSATREQQIRGIAQVTMTLRPTFSIDYIRVIMFLE